MDGQNKKALLGAGAVLVTGVAGWFGVKWWSARRVTVTTPSPLQTVAPQPTATQFASAPLATLERLRLGIQRSEIR